MYYCNILDNINFENTPKGAVLMKPIDYTKNGVLNWICIQDDDKDMIEVISMCFKKIDAMNYLKKKEQKGCT